MKKLFIFALVLLVCVSMVTPAVLAADAGSASSEFVDSPEYGGDDDSSGNSGDSGNQNPPSDGGTGSDVDSGTDGSADSDAPHTGDDSNLAMWIGILVAACAALVAVVVVYRRKMA